MSLVSGPTMSVNRALSAAMTPRVSSTLKRRLGDEGDRGRPRKVEGGDVAFRRDQVHRRVHLPERAHDLGMAGMADQHQRPALGDIVPALSVHLGDQRAGRVEHRQAARARLLHHRGGRHAR